MSKYDESIDPRYHYRDARVELYLMIFDGLITDEDFCIQFDLLTANHNAIFNRVRSVPERVKYAKHGERT